MRNSRRGNTRMNLTRDNPKQWVPLVFRRKVTFLLLPVFALLAFCPPPASARKKPPVTKTVTGQVLDATNNGIVGAAVELTDLTHGKKIALYAQQGGHFQFAGLSFEHDYQLRATYKGLSSEVRKVSSWDMRARLVMNLHIPPPKD